jgi:hypothetical protein
VRVGFGDPAFLAGLPAVADAEDGQAVSPWKEGGVTAPPKPEKRAPRPRKRIERTPLKPSRKCGLLAHECGQKDETKPCLRKPIKRKKPPNKLSQKNLPKLKRKLWALLTAYVKDRDGNTCVSCGKGGLSGKGWHGGHLFPAGKHNIIRYDPKNVHSQCFNCNIDLGGNGAAYAVWHMDKYGMDEFKRLSTLSRHMKSWRSYEIQELIEALQKGGHYYESLYAEKYGLIPMATDLLLHNDGENVNEEKA